MHIDALPSRPLTLDEVYYGLHQSEQFIEATCVNVIVDDEKSSSSTHTTGLSFALDIVLVTNDNIVAVQYDVDEQDWLIIYETANRPNSEKTDEGVVREKVAKARRKLEDSVTDLESQGLAGEVTDTEDLEEGRAVTREAPELTERIRHQYEEKTSNS